MAKSWGATRRSAVSVWRSGVEIPRMVPVRWSSDGRWRLMFGKEAMAEGDRVLAFDTEGEAVEYAKGKWDTTLTKLQG